MMAVKLSFTLTSLMKAMMKVRKAVACGANLALRSLLDSSWLSYCSTCSMAAARSFQARLSSSASTVDGCRNPNTRAGCDFAGSYGSVAAVPDDSAAISGFF